MAKDGLDISKAILHLVSGASFRIENDDLSTLEWNCDLARPSDAEIKAALPIVAKADADAAQAKTDARNAVLAKLGLTAEEVTALLA
jgi:hypothetical protein